MSLPWPPSLDSTSAERSSGRSEWDRSLCRPRIRLPIKLHSQLINGPQTRCSFVSSNLFHTLSTHVRASKQNTLYSCQTQKWIMYSSQALALRPRTRCPQTCHQLRRTTFLWSPQTCLLYPSKSWELELICLPEAYVVDITQSARRT